MLANQCAYRIVLDLIWSSDWSVIDVRQSASTGCVWGLTLQCQIHGETVTFDLYRESDNRKSRYKHWVIIPEMSIGINDCIRLYNLAKGVTDEIGENNPSYADWSDANSGAISYKYIKEKIIAYIGDHDLQTGDSILPDKHLDLEVAHRKQYSDGTTAYLCRDSKSEWADQYGWTVVYNGAIETYGPMAFELTEEYKQSMAMFGPNKRGLDTLGYGTIYAKRKLFNIDHEASFLLDQIKHKHLSTHVKFNGSIEKDWRSFDSCVVGKYGECKMLGHGSDQMLHLGTNKLADVTYDTCIYADCSSDGEILIKINEQTVTLTANTNGNRHHPIVHEGTINTGVYINLDDLQCDDNPDPVFTFPQSCTEEVKEKISEFFRDTYQLKEGV